MKRVNLKQGTLSWEQARENRIGSSEVFDIVRYYATDEELQNCGIDAEDFRAEEPYTTAWALYHKMIGDGLCKRKALAAKYAEYGHVCEPYGVKILQKGRTKKLKPGVVYADERLIASLDIEGIAEEIDIRPFDKGHGKPKIGQRFVCEQKTMMPQKIKTGMPYKYIVQAQYQVTKTKADFFIIQIMILKNCGSYTVEDVEFVRGKVCGMSTKKRKQFLDNNLSVSHYYFQNNEHLSQLIQECLKRFFDDVDNRREPKPYIESDSIRNIIEGIRINTFYNDDFEIEVDLSELTSARDAVKLAKENLDKVSQKLIDMAKKYNACRFRSSDGTTARYIKNGSLRVEKPTEKAVGV